MAKATEGVKSETVKDIFLIRSGRNREKYDENKIKDYFEIISMSSSNTFDGFYRFKRQFYFT